MIEVDRYRFTSIKPQQLTAKQLRQLEALTSDSIRLDFPHRTPRERRNLAARSVAAREKLSRGEGVTLFTDRQRFLNYKYLLAYKKEGQQVVAALPVADNISARTVPPFSQIETKLKARSAVHRYYWAGLCILNREARMSLDNTPPDEASITDVLITLGTMGRDEQQPATAYPYVDRTTKGEAGELTWRRALDSAGYRETLVERPVKAFGETARVVTQELWRANSIADIQVRAMTKFGMPEALQAAGLVISPLQL